MDFASLKSFYEARRDRGAAMALATVVATQGSTYSKAGALMLIDEHGIFQGMLSGGCLEGDLAIRAQQVIESGAAQLVEYDLAADDEELWGLGVGCDGLMVVLLQTLHARDAYEPIASIVEALQRGTAVAVSSVFESGTAAAPLAATAVYDGKVHKVFGLDSTAAGLLEARAEAVLRGAAPDDSEAVINAAAFRCLTTRLSPPPTLLVAGAGLDALPVVRFANELGWRCVVTDHRPAYLEKGDFSSAQQLVCSEAGNLADAVDLKTIDAAIVMSHHLASDREYLRVLAATQIGYVGLLGPGGRRDRLLSEIGDAATLLAGRLHGPAGIDIGGRGPGPIALSIVAGVQRYLSGREA